MSPVNHFWELILGTVIALLPIINPLASTPVFLAITEGDSDARRREQAKWGCIYMVAILVAFLIGGTFIMNFFGLSIPGLRIAGGLLVSRIGLNMLLTSPESDADEKRRRDEARAKSNIAFTPLAMPMLSGPGSIAVTVGFTSLSTEWPDYIAIIAGIIVVAVISYITLSLSSRIVRIIGVNGMNALTKIMGFLILCIGIQFVVNGVVGVASDPTVLRGIREAMTAN